MRSSVHDYGVSDDYDVCSRCGTKRPKHALDLAPDGAKFECADRDWCERQIRAVAEAKFQAPPPRTGKRPSKK